MRGILWNATNSTRHIVMSAGVYDVSNAFELMDQEPTNRPRYRWPKEARDLVKQYMGNHDMDANSGTDAKTVRDLVTQLNEITGHPRPACLYFARQLGVTKKQHYREWTTVEQQKLLDLVALHPPNEVAKIMRRSPGSIRGMLHRLDATAQMGREWFTVYTLAEALHISVQEVQRWIALGWLNSRIVSTGKLKKPIIDPDDFAEFCKQHRKEVVGRRLNADRLEFVHKFVFPPSHVELLPAREQGYKTRRKLAAALDQEGRSAQAGFKFEPDCDLPSRNCHEDHALESA